MTFARLPFSPAFFAIAVRIAVPILAWAESAPARTDTSGHAAAGSNAEVTLHWAYRPPIHRGPPAVAHRDWIQNPIDNFVLAQLEREHLRPARPASRETLIRRLSLDLIGLPPTVEEVTAFVEDTRPDAYERLVDRLLASPHYGERWARPWLDQARYADSNGYEADMKRTIWPYRDWVIRAFNRDIPFSEFVIEQIAGDLLPGCTREQKIATGFNRNTMVNTEGGTDEEEFRVAAIVDRINTTFEVFMGTTIGCCQCHDHKYDPFTQKEFYQLFSIFNQSKDHGRDNSPEMELPTPAQAVKLAEIRKKLEPLEKALQAETPELKAAQEKWEKEADEAARQLAGQWQSLDPEEFEATGGVALERLGDRSVLAGGALPERSEYKISLPLPKGKFSALQLEALVDGSLPHKSSGRSEDGNFVLSEITSEAYRTTGETNKPTELAFQKAYSDFAESGYESTAAIDHDSKTGWSIGAQEPKNRTDHAAVFVLKSPLAFEEGGRLVVHLQQQSERKTNLLGRFRLAISSAPITNHLTWAAVPPSSRAVLSLPRDRWAEADRKTLTNDFRSLDPGLNKIRAEIDDLKKQEPKEVASTLVMEKVEKPRETHILVRGSFLNPGAKVEPGVPAVLHPWCEGATVDRLGFARWLVDPQNPLLGRVNVNRIWAQYFGQGFVETSEDFGTQGEPPNYPELLDWLATEWIRQGWSLKALHRLIVTSATYQQNSQATPDLLARDPFNRLLARGPRFRMEAEMLRDSALAIGGILTEKIGGPSVFPYQPDGVWNSPYNRDQWKMSAHGDQFRRGLYTFWRRTAPYASFMAFDAPSREVTCLRRSRSNTPLQALVTLNDPAFLAASSALARAVVERGGTNAEENVCYAFQRCLARLPSAGERDSLLDLYRRALANYQRDGAAAEATASVAVGNPAGSKAAVAELAAWTVVANVLLNLDETLTKG